MHSLALVVSIGLAGTLPAQPDPNAPKKLTVSPAPAPRPALKIALLPEAKDRTPGNAALGYFRTFAARPPVPSKETAAANDAKMTKWHDTPVAELPVADVRKHLETYNMMLRELDKAVVCERCDWEMGPRIKADGIGVFLNEVQQSREVMWYLTLKTRADLAENKFDDAARDLRSGFQLAQHMGEGATMIQLLVGLALEAIVLERVEEWIARPGSPNLYWSLTALPHPLINPKPAIDGEAVFSELFFPGIRELERERLSPERAAKIVEDLFNRASGATRDPDKPNNDLELALKKLGVTGYVALHVQDAKAELLARGRAAKDIEAMTPSQAVFLNSLERFQELRDDQLKWFGQPYYVARPALQATEDRRKKLLNENNADPVFSLFALVLPAVEKVHFATVRTDRKLASLRVIEAVRMHVAATGKLPAALADVTAVPVPADPVTGKPFAYAVAGNGFTLVAPPPAGETANPGNTLNYAITLR